MNITCRYFCDLCALSNIEVSVPARENEDVLIWMEMLGRRLSEDHASRSPHCHPENLTNVMIPMTGAKKVGGPPVN